MIKYKYKLKSQKKNIAVSANLHIQCTLKNTILSLTKGTGDLLKQWSTKSLKKTKFKKNTLYNIHLILYKINNYIQLKKISKLNIYLKGYCFGRSKILKGLQNKKYKINYIFYKNSIPFNGCRKKKKRRL